MTLDLAQREKELRLEAEKSIISLRTMIPEADDAELDIILDMIYVNQKFLELYGKLEGIRDARPEHASHSIQAAALLPA